MVLKDKNNLQNVKGGNSIDFFLVGFCTSIIHFYHGKDQEFIKYYHQKIKEQIKEKCETLSDFQENFFAESRKYFKSNF